MGAVAEGADLRPSSSGWPSVYTPLFSPARQRVVLHNHAFQEGCAFQASLLSPARTSSVRQRSPREENILYPSLPRTTCSSSSLRSRTSQSTWGAPHSVAGKGRCAVVPVRSRPEGSVQCQLRSHALTEVVKSAKGAECRLCIGQDRWPHFQPLRRSLIPSSYTATTHITSLPFPQHTRAPPKQKRQK